MLNRLFCDSLNQLPIDTIAVYYRLLIREQNNNREWTCTHNKITYRKQLWMIEDLHFS